MPHNPTHEADGERKYVEHVLRAMIRNAELDADRVAALLVAHGVRPTPRRQREGSLVDSRPTGPLADVLLHWAAALRLRSWERAGLRSRLPDTLPSANSAVDVAAEIATASTTADAPLRESTPIPLTVFRTWLERFAINGPAELVTDVLLDIDAGDSDTTLIDALALILWEGRHLGQRPVKEKA